MPGLRVASIEIICLNVDHTKDLMRQNALRQNTISKAMGIFIDRPDIIIWYKSWSHRPASVGTLKNIIKLKENTFTKRD